MNPPQQPPQPPQPPAGGQQQRVQIELPSDLTAVYSNIAFITHSPAELILDFGQILPRTPKGKIMARVIMSPMHAKALLQALAQNIATYEQQFGEIKVPVQPTLADQFFRFSPPSGTNNSSGGGDEEK
jgi:hypothetical protein